MGNTTKKIQANTFADWCDHTPCHCNENDLKISFMKHKAVPLTDKTTIGLTNIARTLTLGVLELYLRGQAFTHDCIQFALECPKCSWKGCCTLEFSDNPDKPKKRYGKYCKSYTGVWFNPRIYIMQKNLTMKHLNEEYEEKFNWDASKYRLNDNNCKTYADYIYNTISQKY